MKKDDGGSTPMRTVIARDKTSLDIFWIKDKSLTDLDNLPDPDILANEIIENIESGLTSFQGDNGIN
jgi:type I restriction enzyme M protein